MGKKLITEFRYDIVGTPCESVIEEARLVHIPDRVIELYPGDRHEKSALSATWACRC
jgi:hypothetical protein